MEGDETLISTNINMKWGLNLMRMKWGAMEEEMLKVAVESGNGVRVWPEEFKRGGAGNYRDGDGAREEGGRARSQGGDGERHGQRAAGEGEQQCAGGRSSSEHTHNCEGEKLALAMAAAALAFQPLSPLVGKVPLLVSRVPRPPSVPGSLHGVRVTVLFPSPCDWNHTPHARPSPPRRHLGCSGPV